MKIHLADSPYWEDSGLEFQQKFLNLLEKTYKEATVLLSFGSRYVNFFVQPREYDLIEETHDAARTYNSEFIEYAFDPDYYRKLSNAELQQHIRATVFHEMNHAARYNLGIWHTSFLDSCIMEGLATVFEREHAGTEPLWGDYPPAVTEWVDEIVQTQDIDSKAYMYAHPDGRKWIGYKVGTYIVDQAMQQSGKTVVDLTQLECKDILNMSGATK